MISALHITRLPEGIRADCDVATVANRALHAVTSGRYFGFLWPIGLPKGIDATWEHQLVTHLLRCPASRLGPSGEGSGTEYFVTQFIRTYSNASPNRPVTELACVLFRDASGPPAYKVRLEREEPELNAARLPTKHPAFTRDFANNVWHIPDTDHAVRTVRRLAQLLTWPGETFALVKWDGSVVIDEVNRGFNNDLELIPRARKTPYAWRSDGTEQMLFERGAAQ